MKVTRQYNCNLQCIYHFLKVLVQITMQVQVLYDFEAQPNSSELSIFTGETLTITRQDIGDGWWEGRNDRGQTGLFPAAYVQVHFDIV